MTFCFRALLTVACAGTAALGCGGAPSSAFPETCKDVQAAALAATGQRPADGTYALYVAGAEAQPWTAHCRNMNSAEPSEYLSVTAAANYSRLSDGVETTETKYARLRINPKSLAIDPLDVAFATTTSAAKLTGFLPDGRPDLPAGWAQYVGSTGSGPATQAHIDLAGTPFVFTAAVRDNNAAFFCTYSGSPPMGDASGSTRQISDDRSAVTLTAINTAGKPTKTVADCANLGGADDPGKDDFTTAAWPLQYKGP